MAGKRKGANGTRSDDSRSERGKISTLSPLTSVSVSRLLTLPRELRDQIYDHAWQQTAEFTIQYNELTYSVRYGSSENLSEIRERAELRRSLGAAVVFVSQQKNKHAFTGAGWLFTNRQILHEAIQQFRRKTIWSVIITIDNPFPIWNPRSLIAPWTAQSLALDISGGTWQELDSSGKTVARVQFNEPAISWLKQASDRMSRSTLQYLTVHCHFKNSCHFIQHVDVDYIVFDFKPLEKLQTPKLKVVEIITSFRKPQALGPVETLLTEEISERGDCLLRGQARRLHIGIEHKPDAWVWRYVFEAA